MTGKITGQRRRVAGGLVAAESQERYAERAGAIAIGSSEEIPVTLQRRVALRIVDRDESIATIVREIAAEQRAGVIGLAIAALSNTVLAVEL